MADVTSPTIEMIREQLREIKEFAALPQVGNRAEVEGWVQGIATMLETAESALRNVYVEVAAYRATVAEAVLTAAADKLPAGGDLSDLSDEDLMEMVHSAGQKPEPEAVAVS